MNPSTSLSGLSFVEAAYYEASLLRVMAEDRAFGLEGDNISSFSASSNPRSWSDSESDNGVSPHIVPASSQSTVPTPFDESSSECSSPLTPLSSPEESSSEPFFSPIPPSISPLPPPTLPSKSVFSKPGQAVQKNAIALRLLATQESQSSLLQRFPPIQWKSPDEHNASHFSPRDGFVGRSEAPLACPVLSEGSHLSPSMRVDERYLADFKQVASAIGNWTCMPSNVKNFLDSSYLEMELMLVVGKVDRRDEKNVLQALLSKTESVFISLLHVFEQQPVNASISNCKDLLFEKYSSFGRIQ
jgi:hypothetical protein